MPAAGCQRRAIVRRLEKSVRAILCLTGGWREERRHRKHDEKQDYTRKPSRRRKSGLWLLRIVSDPGHRVWPNGHMEIHRAKTEATALTQINLRKAVLA